MPHGSAMPGPHNPYLSIYLSICLSIRLDVRRGGRLARALVAAALGLVVRNPFDLLAHLARVEGEGWVKGGCEGVGGSFWQG